MVNMKKSISLLIILLFVPLIYPWFIPFNVFAATIKDGDLVRVENSIDVYIVKLAGAEKYKRLILNPEIFNQYGHLKWENIKTVSQTELEEYTISDLVRTAGEEKVYKLYPNGDIGEKRWIKTADDFAGFGYKASAIYEINSFERDFYVAGEDLTYQAPIVPPEPPARTIPMTIYVPADYSTIQAAINAAINGDIIVVSNGTYNENLSIDKEISLIGNSHLATIINGQGNGNAITLKNVKNVLIKKFTIKAKDKYAIYCSSDIDKDTIVTIKNNVIIDSYWGIMAENNCQFTILNNILYNNRSADNKDGGGIYIKGNSNYGIKPEIRNNTVDDNHHGIVVENSKIKTLNNIISRNLGSGTSAGIYLKGGGMDNDFNDVWGNGYDYVGGAATGDNSIFTDPKFVYVTERNYRLAWGSGSGASPCVDRGHSNVIYNDGQLLTGTVYRNDMGAYGGPDNVGWGL
jgi:hypothetical protein